MNQLSGWSTNNRAVTMLDSLATPSMGSSSVANSVVSSTWVTTSPSFVLTAQDLSKAFSRALGDSLPQILVAMQTKQASSCQCIEKHTVTCLSYFPVNSSPGFAAVLSTCNIVVSSFISTYFMLHNSSLSHPSFGSHSVFSGALHVTSQFSFPAFSTPTLAHSVVSLLHKPFVISPGYSPISEKLVTKI